MKVLHIYPKSNDLIRQHVMLLAEGMQQSADILTADSGTNIRQQIIEEEPDILQDAASLFLPLFALQLLPVLDPFL